MARQQGFDQRQGRVQRRGLAPGEVQRRLADRAGAIAGLASRPRDVAGQGAPGRAASMARGLGSISA